MAAEVVKVVPSTRARESRPLTAPAHSAYGSSSSPSSSGTHAQVTTAELVRGGARHADAAARILDDAGLGQGLDERALPLDSPAVLPRADGDRLERDFRCRFIHMVIHEPYWNIKEGCRKVLSAVRMSAFDPLRTISEWTWCLRRGSTCEAIANHQAPSCRGKFHQAVKRLCG